MFNMTKMFSGFICVIVCKMFVSGILFRTSNLTTIRTDNKRLVLSNSLTECAGYCELEHQNCNRLLYEYHTKQCTLISHLLTSVFTIPSGWQLFYPVNEECSVPDYIFDPITNTCMKLYNSTYNYWTDARLQCQADGGDLIVIQNEEKLKYVLSYIDHEERTWVGLKGNTWINGDRFDQDVLNLADDEISIVNDTDKNCGRIRLFKTKKLFRSNKCSVGNKFLCEIMINS